jgi:hypothetical protein
VLWLLREVGLPGRRYGAWLGGDHEEVGRKDHADEQVEDDELPPANGAVGNGQGDQDEDLGSVGNGRDEQNGARDPDAAQGPGRPYLGVDVGGHEEVGPLKGSSGRLRRGQDGNRIL